MGFYRTCYSADSLQQLVSAIGQKTLPPLDRLGLIDDVFALVQAGHSPTVDALKLLQVSNSSVIRLSLICFPRLEGILYEHHLYLPSFRST